eukprot:216547-Rhodomonas_salina.6
MVLCGTVILSERMGLPGGLAILQYLKSFHVGNRTGILRMNRMSLASLPLEMAVKERITELDVSKNQVHVYPILPRNLPAIG